jgi:folate-binding protein YgfZ
MTAPAPPVVIGPAELPEEFADALLSGTVMSPAGASVVEVSGSGALTCLQGMLTCDLEGPGDGAFVYGAMLSPKGMIRADLWAARAGGTVFLSIPTAAREIVLDTFQKQIPPRLARVTDHAGSLTVLRLAGPTAVAVAERAGIAVSPAGRAGRSAFRPTECFVCSSPEGGPFALEIHAATGEAGGILAALTEAGAVEAPPTALELSRIVAGWPSLGAEIDDKTLPQEVRYDEINGVSYTKGCYTGQETVARLHFRGHTNRNLRGIAWQDPPDFQQSAIRQDEKVIGRVTSIAWCAPFMQYLGLGIIRRDADAEAAVIAAAAPARIAELPFRFSF